MLRAHKIALAPNNAQATHLARACGVARFAYNWALADKQTASGTVLLEKVKFSWRLMMPTSSTTSSIRTAVKSSM